MTLRAGLLALLVCVSAARADGGQRSTGSVRGRVVDAQTGQPLEHARVMLDGQPGRVLTGPEGRFLLADVPAGAGVLQVSLVGYALARRDVEIPAGGSTDLTIPLAEGTGTYAEDVKVQGDLFPREASGVPSQTIIGSAELQNLRGLLADDPMRAVQTLPGVSGTDDFRSDFSVRASNFRHVGVTLDGVPSTLLAHTVRNVQDGGSLAMINSDILESVSLVAGSYPQRFGDRTGAHVDFRTREGSRDRTHGRLAVSAINASLVTEGPLGRERRGSWLFSIRKSYLDWLIRRIDPEVSGTFGFVDGHGKVVVDLSARHTLTMNFVAGRSRYEERDEDPGPNSLEIGRHRSVLASVALRSSIGGRLVVTQRGYGVFNRFSNDNASSLSLQNGTERDASYRADLTAAGWRAVSLDAGVHLQSLRATGQESIYDGTGLAIDRQTFSTTRARQGGYVLARVSPHAGVRLTPGVRLDRWTLTGEAKASPWIQGEILLPGAFLVAAGTGIYRQAPDVWEVDGPHGNPLRAEHARHVDLGVGQQIGSWRWQATVFDRREGDVVRLPGTESWLVNGRVVLGWDLMRYQNALDGSARGLELAAQRRSANGLSGWVGYALTNAEYEDVGTGETFSADAEQRHSVNVYAHYRLSSRSSVSGRLRAATNTPLAGYYRAEAGRVFLSDRRNEERLPFYSRLDLRGNRTFDVGRGRLTLHVEIVNVYNRRNLRGRDSPGVSRRTGEVRNATERMFPILPSAGFTVEF